MNFSKKSDTDINIDKIFDYELIQSILDTNFKKVLELFEKSTEISNFESFVIKTFAGADIEVLKRCSLPEKNKYFALGLGVCTSTLLAFISSFYFFYIFYLSSYKSFGFGAFIIVLSIAILVSFIIFMIEFSIVSTQNTHWSSIVLRVLLSAFMGFTFAQPLEVFIFQNSIKEKLSDTKMSKKTNQISIYESKDVDLSKQLVTQKALKDSAYRTMKNKDNSMVRHCSDKGKNTSICKEWTRMYLFALGEYNSVKKTYDILESRLKQNQDERKNTLDTIDANYSNDVLKQMRMLNQVTDDWLSYIFRISIMFLLIIFDAFPALLKVSAKESGYKLIFQVREVLEQEHQSIIKSYNMRYLESRYEYDYIKQRYENKLQIMEKIISKSQDSYLKLISNSDQICKKMNEIFSEIDKYKEIDEHAVLVEKYRRTLDKTFDKFALDVQSYLNKLSELNSKIKFPED